MVAIGTLEGKGEALPMDFSVARGFPKVRVDSVGFVMSQSTDYVVSLDSISNYDSLIVELRGNYSHRVRKAVGKGSNHVTFTVAEMQEADVVPAITYLVFHAYNYSTRTIGNKLYLYELAHKVQKKVELTN